jgi:branched-chain amino acid transport system substrate-binding protein
MGCLKTAGTGVQQGETVMLNRRAFVGAAAAGLAAPALVRAQGTAPIRIGEVNSYTTAPAFTLPYRNGWQLAVDDINAAGGVLGRRIEVLSRDDAGQPQNATQLAGELISDAHVDLLAGGFLSNVGLALSDFSARHNTLYVAGEPLTDALVWSRGTATCFRLRPSTYLQIAMMMPHIVKLKAKRWATIAPNYEYGQSAVKWFKQLLAAQRPDVSFVADQLPALGKIDAGATVQALADASPDGIFNVTFGPDLTNFVRQGNTRGLFDGREVVSVLTGEPEYLLPLGDETPEGWLVTGYPVGQVATAQAFEAAYLARFKEAPRMGSVVGYALIHSIAAGIARAGEVTTAKLEAGFSGAGFDTPFGRATYRALDHQSTLGTFVGRTALKDGHGTMVDFQYVDGSDAQPSDAEVRKLRPGA